METIEFKLQRCLNNIEDWATENFQKQKLNAFIFVRYVSYI